MEPTRPDPDAVVLTEGRRTTLAPETSGRARPRPTTHAPNRKTRAVCGDIRLNRSGPPTNRVLSRSRTGAVLRHTMQARGRSRIRAVDGEVGRGPSGGAASTRESGSPVAAGSSAACHGRRVRRILRWAARWELPPPPSGSRRCGTRAGRCTARPRCAAGRPSVFAMLTFEYSCSAAVVSFFATASWSATSDCSEMRSRPFTWVSFSLTQLSFTTSLVARASSSSAEHLGQHRAHPADRGVRPGELLLVGHLRRPLQRGGGRLRRALRTRHRRSRAGAGWPADGRTVAS